MNSRYSCCILTILVLWLAQHSGGIRINSIEDSGNIKIEYLLQVSLKNIPHNRVTAQIAVGSLQGKERPRILCRYTASQSSMTDAVIAPNGNELKRYKFDRTPFKRTHPTTV